MVMALFAAIIAINWQTGKQLTAHFVQQRDIEYPWPQNVTMHIAGRNIDASGAQDKHEGTETTESFGKDRDDPVIYNTTASPTHRNRYQAEQDEANEEGSLFSWQNKSSVDYFGCCGAGHRLSRTANAFWVARHILNFGLRVYWRFCGSVEVFSYLFHPQPVEELRNVTSWNQNIYFHNEIPGFVPFNRVLVESKGKRPCKCKLDKIQSDAEFYASLRDRYRFKHQVDQFRVRHFDGAALNIGLHIRAGNNETGDFTIKGRGIERIDEWVHHVARHILSLVNTWAGKNVSQSSTPATAARVVVYLATDTPSMLSSFRSLLMINASTISNMAAPYWIQVLEFPQRRLKEGGGVVFGSSETGEMDGGNECLQSWESIFSDLILLSHVDILVAPRSSSFTQTLPMSLVFAQRLAQHRQLLQTQQAFSGGNSSHVELPPAFCEMNRNASIMNCYDTFVQWCCESNSYEVGTHFLVPGKKLKWDPMPRREICLPSPEARGRPGYCLPYRWPKDMQEQRPVVSRHRRREKLKNS